MSDIPTLPWAVKTLRGWKCERYEHFRCTELRHDPHMVDRRDFIDFYDDGTHDEGGNITDTIRNAARIIVATGASAFDVNMALNL